MKACYQVTLMLAALTFGAECYADELRLCISNDPTTFDPIQAADENSEIVQYLTGGALLSIDRATDELRPDLADSWSVDKTGRSISFHLRSGLKFSDGSTLTADDVARTLREAFDPKNASPVGDAFRSSRGFPAIDVISPQRITLRYPVVKAGLERLFDQLYIARPDIARNSSSRVPASAGPFFVSDYRAGVAVVVKRNPYYWKRDATGRQLPYLDSIRLDIQSNRDQEVSRFMRGDLDMIRKLDPASFVRIAKQTPSAVRDLGPSMDSEFLWFNQSPSGTPGWKRKWFTSAVFRHAISASINREDLVRVAWLNRAHPASGPLSPANRFWFNPVLKPLPFDPEFAMKALRSQGFTLRGGILHDRDGHAVEFSLVTNANNQARQSEAAMIQTDLLKIGIRVSVVTLDFGSLIDRIARTSQYDACLLGFTTSAVDPMEESNLWLSSGSAHAWWPSQKSPATDWESRVDQLVLAQASESSRAVRQRAFYEVQRIMVAEEPVIYLVNPDYLTAVGPSIRNVTFSEYFPQPLSNIESVHLR